MFDIVVHFWFYTAVKVPPWPDNETRVSSEITIRRLENFSGDLPALGAPDGGNNFAA